MAPSRSSWSIAVLPVNSGSCSNSSVVKSGGTRNLPNYCIARKSRTKLRTIRWFLHLWAVAPTSPFQCLHSSHLHSVFLKGLAQSADRQSRLPLLLSKQWSFPTSLLRLNIFVPRLPTWQTWCSPLSHRRAPHSRSPSPHNSSLCRYHCHFGDGTCKYKVPCSKVGNALASC